MELTFENILKLVFYKYWYGEAEKMPKLNIMLGLNVSTPDPTADFSFNGVYYSLRFRGELRVSEQELGSVRVYLIGGIPGRGIGGMAPCCIRGRHLKKIALKGFYQGVIKHDCSLLSIYRPSSFEHNSRKLMLNSRAFIPASQMHPTAHEAIEMETQLKQLKKIAGEIRWN